MSDETKSRAAILAEVMREAGVSELGRYHLVEGELCVRQPSFTHEELKAIWLALPRDHVGTTDSVHDKLDAYMHVFHGLQRSLVRNGE